MKVRELIAELRREGWVWVRTRGSHRQFAHPVRPGCVTVSGSMGREVPIGLERAIRRQAGLRGKP